MGATGALTALSSWIPPHHNPVLVRASAPARRYRRIQTHRVWAGGGRRPTNTRCDGGWNSNGDRWPRQDPHSICKTRRSPTTGSSCLDNGATKREAGEGGGVGIRMRSRIPTIPFQPCTQALPTGQDRQCTPPLHHAYQRLSKRSGRRSSARQAPTGRRGIGGPAGPHAAYWLSPRDPHATAMASRLQRCRPCIIDSHSLSSLGSRWDVGQHSIRGPTLILRQRPGSLGRGLALTITVYLWAPLPPLVSDSAAVGPSSTALALRRTSRASQAPS